MSDRYTLNKEDFVKIGKGAAIAVSGALAAYLSQDVIPFLDDADLPSMLLASGLSVVVNLLRKFVNKQTVVASLLLFCLTLPASGLIAQEVDRADVPAASVKVDESSQDVEADQLAVSVYRAASIRLGGCSGTIVAIGSEYAYGVSASHCRGSADTFSYTTYDGERGVGRWVMSDSGSDLSLFKIYAKDAPASVPVWADDIKVGKARQFVGYGMHGSKRYEYQGEKSMVESGSRKKFDRYGFKLVGGKFAGGDSGGGVFLDDELIGVISHGTDMKYTYTSQHGQIVKFLEEAEKKCGLRDFFVRRRLNCQPPPLDNPLAPPPSDVVVDNDVPVPSVTELIAKINELEAKLAGYKPEAPELDESVVLELVNRVVTDRKSELKGEDGQDGKNGRDGKDGLPGSPGLDGNDGRDGRDGQDGADGSVGKTGTITVVLVDSSGKVVATANDVAAGSTAKVVVSKADD